MILPMVWPILPRSGSPEWTAVSLTAYIGSLKLSTNELMIPLMSSVSFEKTGICRFNKTMAEVRLETRMPQ